MRKEFEIPFQFKGDPVSRACVSGISIDRCVLDTGAAYTVLRLPSEFPSLIEINEKGFVELEDLLIEGVQFGPMQVQVRRIQGLQIPELYLGTDQMKSYCVVFDYKNSIAVFTNQPRLNEDSDVSLMSLSNGRPIITFEICGKSKKFVLDSGSNGNWLFYSAQTPEVLQCGNINAKKDMATCGLGNIQINNEISFHNLIIGGVKHKSIAFNLADENAFGGPLRTSEDGIVGTGYFEPTKWRTHIFDFISMKYKMI